MVHPNRRYFLFCIDGYYKDIKKKKKEVALLENKLPNGFAELVCRMQLRVSHSDQWLFSVRRQGAFVISPCMTPPRRRRYARRRVGSLLVNRSRSGELRSHHQAVAL